MGCVIMRDMSVSALPGVPEQLEATEFMPLDSVPFPGCTSREMKSPVCVKLLLDLPPKSPFFPSDDHIIINTQERHDVKMKLLKTVFWTNT